MSYKDVAYGGYDAIPNEFPFVVQIQNVGSRVSHLCGGSIATSLLIITAAHCVADRNLKKYKVVAGEHRLGESFNTSSEQEAYLTKIHVHPDYERIKEGPLDISNNDIAVLELKNPLKFTSHIHYIGLQNSFMDIKNEMKGWAIGWGKMTDEKKPSDVLQKVEIPILNHNNCQDRLKSGKATMFKNTSLICGEDHGKIICDGDSGGPFFYKDENNEILLLGISAFSSNQCTRKGISTSFFASISYHWNWLEHIIMNGSICGVCSSNQFRCDNGQCEDKSKVCDGHNDCNDGSDEIGCENCTATEFRCIEDKKCVSSTLVCDMKKDCLNGTDEFGCQFCNTNQFLCQITELCINEELLCNGRNDCIDGSDEAKCGNCTEYEFFCKNSNCINLNFVCDGENDCKDGSDETNCYKCKTDEFSCSNNNCVDLTKICDGKNDCGDGSDEAGCENCESNEFKCKSGECIDIDLVCDSQNDCKNGIDEIGCNSCAKDEFKCHLNEICLNQTKVCDGVKNCQDGSDEVFCGKCSVNEFQCQNGECIDSSKVCQFSTPKINRTDCSDESDEKGCFKCEGNNFQCKNQKCIDLKLICNGKNNCDDGSDELNCGACAANEFQCKNKDCISNVQVCDGDKDCSDASDEFGCGNCNESEFHCGLVNKCLNESNLCDGNNDCLFGSDEANCENCIKNQFKCKNGECVDYDNVCDGDKDCKDGSDEMNCKLCSVDQFSCRNNEICINRTKVCNGVNDCEDGSDEINCGNCNLTSFRCGNGECINKDFICDKIANCEDLSDEKGCSLMTLNGAICAGNNIKLSLDRTKCKCDGPINNIKFFLHEISSKEYRCYSLYEQGPCLGHEWLVLVNGFPRCKHNRCYKNDLFKKVKCSNHPKMKIVIYKHECLPLGSECKETGSVIYNATTNKITCEGGKTISMQNTIMDVSTTPDPFTEDSPSLDYEQ